MVERAFAGAGKKRAEESQVAGTSRMNREVHVRNL
jgi:hypothetical protein